MNRLLESACESYYPVVDLYNTGEPFKVSPDKIIRGFAIIECDAPDFNLDYFMVIVKNTKWKEGDSPFDGTHWFYLSFHESVYVKDPEAEFPMEHKILLMEILNNGGWKKLVDTAEEGCVFECEDERFKCDHYVHRKLPATPPDYTKLP